MKLRTRIAIAVASVVAATATVFVQPSSAATAIESQPAQAGKVMSAQDDVETFRNGATGRCLSQYSPWNQGWRVGAVPCNSSSIYWTVHYLPGGTVKLEMNWGCAYDSGTGFVKLTPCDDNDDSAKWFPDHYIDGSVRFRNVRYGWCIDDSDNNTDVDSWNGDLLRMFPCHDGPWQRWY